MSDNKIFDDEFVFEEKIDFEGLEDEAEKQSIETEEADETDISTESDEEIGEPEVEENDLEDFSAYSETEDADKSLPAADTSEDEASADFPNELPCLNDEYFSDKSTDDAEKAYKDSSVSRLCIISTAISAVTLCAVAAGIAFGYNYISSVEEDLAIKNAEIAKLEEKNSILEEEYIEAMNLFEEKEAEKASSSDEIELGRGKILLYDTSVGYSWAPVLEGVKKNEYKTESFELDSRGRLSYIESGENSSYFGIDVSSYQGDIDWQLVKEDNVEFAFLRIGYRGYGEEGKMCPDESFVNNYAGAHDAGIDLGVYFFSQAVSVEEAVEEANYVLSLLEGRTLEYPIVFDWETVQTGDPEDIPRTEDVMPQTLTLSAVAFCETIRDAGYDAMIYTNKKLATIKYDLRQLQDYPIWLAYYDTELNYCYDFDIWQYGTGQVDGIDGEVDINIAIIK